MKLLVKNLNPLQMDYCETIFTIGCFDYMHVGHESILDNLKNSCKNLVIGIHDDNSLKKIKNLDHVQDVSIREKNVRLFTSNTFIIYSIDPTESIKNYIENVKKPFELNLNNSIYIRANDNINFPSKNYISSKMNINYIPYYSKISTTQMRKNVNITSMNLFLQKITTLFENNKMLYYLDGELFENCMKYGNILEGSSISISCEKSCRDLLDSYSYHYSNNTIKMIENDLSIQLFLKESIDPDSLNLTILLGKSYYIPKQGDSTPPVMTQEKNLS